MALHPAGMLLPALLAVMTSLGGVRGFMGGASEHGRCERITIPMCRDLKYNMTHMPNNIGHRNQKDAASEIHEFSPLVQFGCSPLLKFFLCSMYAPMCTGQVEETLIIPACRSMCFKVKAKCEPILKQFQFQWPDKLNCMKLPERSGRRNLCMEAPENNADPGHDAPQNRATVNAVWDEILHMMQGRKSTAPPVTDPALQCPPRHLPVTSHSSNATCAPRCGADVLFRQEDKHFTEVWMVVWSGLCFLSTALTVFTFLVDTQRFVYPERPVVFLAMSYCVYSLAYIIRAVLGAGAVSCNQSDGGAYVITEGLESTWCIVVFLILYYFGMSAQLWFVVLTVTWYLAAGRKWGSEAIQNLSSYFHLAAWAIPAIKTIIILTLRRVSGDELTGMCYVARQGDSATTFYALVLGPLCLYLLLGSVFIFSGFIAMFRIRQQVKVTSGNISKLEKLMTKLGVFSVLYTVPASTVIAAHVFIQVSQADWVAQSMRRECVDVDSAPCRLEQSIPTTEIFILQIFMQLVIGITASLWIWSQKTLHSWCSFCSRVCCARTQKLPTVSYTAAHAQQPHRTQVYHKVPVKLPPPRRV